ncbi:hypothetical protein RugamoR64_39000 [Duganella rhizosphaerae]
MHMTCTTHPSKETVRAYLARRAQATPEPPPSPEEIRRQLGWYLIPPGRPGQRNTSTGMVAWASTRCV